MTNSNGDISPEVLPMGQDGLIVRFALTSSAQATSAVQRFFGIADAAGLKGVQEIAAALTSVLFKFDPLRTTRADLAQELGALLARFDLQATEMPDAIRLWHIPVQFGGTVGPQLQEAAAMAGRSEAQAISDVTDTDLRVLTIGFAPGQPYIGLLPPQWDLPRQTELTPKVPAGALVVAVRQLVLFANPSVTGWRQIGLCAFRPFLPTRSEPIALQQGDALRFSAVTEDEMARISADNPDGLGGARCEVLR
ncbi:5-oxoprolinase subunit B family protein [Falsihalocynthiibacter arcticus]|uniref:Carboxyltransferase domain-containing protein n=1 Tax=Falsihalocynthiibacter arcticus TaxID=1579316 RepID=A0A126V206_9RHOB|nr:carboxyltransferase domain-containing protein [Falsihalocynthiibacter arcticus]AML52217.1 hypothetical protein RC74_13890 [Falsihalocynthiibacter arcticus]